MTLLYHLYNYNDFSVMIRYQGASVIVSKFILQTIITVMNLILTCDFYHTKLTVIKNTLI